MAGIWFRVIFRLEQDAVSWLLLSVIIIMFDEIVKYNKTFEFFP